MEHLSSNGQSSSWFASVCADQLDEILASSEDTFFVLDREERYLYVFGRDLALWGHDRSEYLGKSMRDLWIAPDALAPSERHLQSVLASGIPEVETFTTSTVLGPRYFSLTFSPVRGADRGVEAVSVVVRDISEQRQAEGLLHEFAASPKPYLKLLGTAIHDDETILLSDKGLTEMLGYATDELVGKPASQLVTPSAWARLQAGETGPFREQALHKAGAALEVELRSERVPLEDRDLNLTLFFNLEEQEKVQRRLLETEATWKSLVESAAHYIVTTDVGGRMTFVNRSTPGYTREQVMGTKIQQYLSPSMRRVFERNLEEVLLTGRPVQYEAYFYDPVVGTMWLYCALGPIRRGNEIVGLILSAYDITQLKRLHDELEHRGIELEQARELERVKTNFVNILSHELRTPLTSVLGYAEFLEEGLGGELSETQRQFVDQIIGGVRRQEGLVDNLLDFARLDAGTFRLNLEESDLLAKLAELATSFAPIVKEAGIELVLAPTEGPVALTMDAQRIGQVVTNLLSNAIKFSPPGGQVRLTACMQGPHVRIEVQDAGPGITAEERPKLFQRYSQLEAGIRKGRGTGLGLAISKAIVEAHGGQIDVDSTPGQGATFWFTLPLRQPGPSAE